MLWVDGVQQVVIRAIFSSVFHQPVTSKDGGWFLLFEPKNKIASFAPFFCLFYLAQNSDCVILLHQILGLTSHRCVDFHGWHT